MCTYMSVHIPMESNMQTLLSTILRHRCTLPSHASDMNLGSGAFFSGFKIEVKPWNHGWKMGFDLLAKSYPLPGSLC